MARLYEDVHCPECGSFVDQLPIDSRPCVMECEMCGVNFEFPIEEEDEDEELDYENYDELDDSL